MEAWISSVKNPALDTVKDMETARFSLRGRWSPLSRTLQPARSFVYEGVSRRVRHSARADRRAPPPASLDQVGVSAILSTEDPSGNRSGLIDLLRSGFRIPKVARERASERHGRRDGYTATNRRGRCLPAGSVGRAPVPVALEEGLTERGAS